MVRGVSSVRQGIQFGVARRGPYSVFWDRVTLTSIETLSRRDSGRRKVESLFERLLESFTSSHFRLMLCDRIHFVVDELMACLSNDPLIARHSAGDCATEFAAGFETTSHRHRCLPRYQSLLSFTMVSEFIVQP